MAQIRHLQHGLKSLLSFGGTEVVLTHHRPVKVGEQTAKLLMLGILWRDDKFVGLPAKKVVLKS